MKKLKVSFEGKQSNLEAKNCWHGYDADMMFIRGDTLYIVEDDYVREIDLTKEIKNFKVKIIDDKEEPTSNFYIYALDPKIKRRCIFVVIEGYAHSLITGFKFKYKRKK